MLPIEEAIEAITDHTFAAVANFRRYVPDGMRRLQELLDQRNPQQRIVDLAGRRAGEQRRRRDDDRSTVGCSSTNSDARCRTRPSCSASTRISWKKDASVAIAPCFGVLVSQRVGPFTLRREFDASAQFKE